jgi:hypothetical protein
MSTFRYARSISDGEIRIFELQPGDGADEILGSLKVVSLTNPEVEVYNALSYTWGSEYPSQYSILVDGQPFEVRKNLFDALQQLRCSDRQRLWIDAICINQADEEEKKAQIPLMSSIFSDADTVEIWLGTDEDNGELGLRSLNSGELEAIATFEIICAVIDLLQRPWFSRTWIIQELLLSSNDAAFVNCGSIRIPWSGFSSGITEIASTNNLNSSFARSLIPENGEYRNSSPTTPSVIQVASLKNLLSHVMLTHGMSIMMLCGLREAYSSRATQQRQKPDTSLGAILRNSRYAKATIPRDKVYGLCGMIGTAVANKLIQAYQKGVEEIFFATTLHILQHDMHPNLYHEYPLSYRQIQRRQMSLHGRWISHISELHMLSYDSTHSPSLGLQEDSMIKSSLTKMAVR